MPSSSAAPSFRRGPDPHALSEILNELAGRVDRVQKSLTSSSSTSSSSDEPDAPPLRRSRPLILLPR